MPPKLPNNHQRKTPLPRVFPKDSDGVPGAKEQKAGAGPELEPPKNRKIVGLPKIRISKM